MLGQKAASSKTFFGLGNTTNITGLANNTNVIAMGFNSGTSIVSGDAFIMGNDCGSSIVSPHNFIAIGRNCLTNATVNENLAIGQGALGALTTGPFNNAVGQFGTLINATTGLGNNAIGSNAGAIVHAGYHNLCLGHNAGGGNNAFVGSEANKSIFINPSATTTASGQYTDCLFVGFNSGKQTSNASSSITNSSIFGSYVTSDLNNVCVVSISPNMLSFLRAMS